MINVVWILLAFVWIEAISKVCPNSFRFLRSRGVLPQVTVEQTIAKVFRKKKPPIQMLWCAQRNKSQVGWQHRLIWRAVDDVFAPRRGHRAQFETLVLKPRIISDQSFVLPTANISIGPIGKRDTLLLERSR